MLLGGLSLSKRVWVRISRNNTELTLRELHEKIAEIQRENPDLDVFFDGDEYAICSRPRPKTETEGEETKLSSNEMRQRILELLEYGERRNPKAKLDIFTYSTYTPQEDMRSVLAMDSRMHEQRKKTIRRALDVEEYNQAAVVLDSARLQLDREADVLSGASKDIEELREELARANEELLAEREGAERTLGDLKVVGSLVRHGPAERQGQEAFGSGRLSQCHHDHERHYRPVEQGAAK